ncbi:hydantoinase B/oxoprolinase family protein [Amycolatopsis jejuensis]|uniref:hydantoinase B/oxoprolinase family protein n=1 Tax=Amycolatopsis jejuensis TaxID=330084 RepID=UPI000524C2DD|nr:hydantoinase B/oxoprolinase family protein [Amycolatopsis jejuensis]
MTAAIDREILRTRLLAYVEEIAAVLANAAPTAEVSQAREFAVAIADGKGAIVATDNPQQLGSLAQTVAHAVRYFEFDLGDGDLIVTNDPYAGGTRVQDLTLVSPLVLDGELVLHLAARVRIPDLGGQVSGNLYPGATELLAEGVPVTPVKIERFGRPVRDIRAALLLNGRRPEETRQVLDAAVAALGLGQLRVRELVDGYGLDLLHAALAYAQQHAEHLARRLIRSWRRGTYEASRVLDPATVRLTATVEDDSVTLDFTASDEQVPTFVNSPAGWTESCAITAFLTVLGGGIPANSGLTRVVQVRTRPGTITHPVSPAPVGWGAVHCGNEIVDVVAAALSEAAGESLPALTVPRPLVLSRPGNDRSTQTDLGRWAVGGAGAVAGVDGWGAPALSGRAQLPSVEQWETEHSGATIESSEFAMDSAGAGQWTGAPGVETVVAPRPDQRYTLWTATIGHAAGGLGEGTPGRAGEVSLGTAQGWQAAPCTATEQAFPADRLRVRLSGGGGCGNPRARERSAVLADLADELISAETARVTYGVGEAGDE